MKAIRLAAVLMLCAAIFVISVSAQGARPAAPAATPARPSAAPAATPAASNEPVPAAKIALVDTGAFYDEKTGIGKLVAGLRQLDTEFQPRRQELIGLQNRLTTLADEIQKLSNAPGGVVDTKSIQAKQEEGERLARELDYKKKDYEAALQRRQAEIMRPISEEIVRALDAFAKARGITMVLEAGLQGIIVSMPSVDITQAFISEFNSKNPVAAAAPR